jgi:peptidoglycan hydrolase CwlO-like protein/3D (Asp-Asp-Asp) domain-containing protein
MNMKELISKKIKKSGIVLGLSLLAFSAVPAHAATSQADVNQSISTFQSQLNTELTQVNALYAKAQASQQKVQENKDKITSLEGNIAQTQIDVANLKEVVSHQMRAMQSNGNMTLSVVDVITSSKNLADMVMRLTNMSTVMTAESDQAKSLVDKENSLKTMKTSLEKTQTALVQSQQNYQAQATSLQGDISNLKDKISSNQALLSQMQAQAAADKKAHDAALAKSLADAQAKADQVAAAKQNNNSSSNSTSTNNSSNSGSNNTVTTPTNPVVPPTSGGRTLNVQATAYALNGTTAMGIDLSQNPMCIAVDPSVIPLGSMVEVPGYGIAIAGDTGGAIVGNIIDVHFPTNAQAISWGRQNLTITVLS